MEVAGVPNSTGTLARRRPLSGHDDGSRTEAAVEVAGVPNSTGTLARRRPLLVARCSGLRDVLAAVHAARAKQLQVG